MVRVITNRGLHEEVVVPEIACDRQAPGRNPVGASKFGNLPETVREFPEKNRAPKQTPIYYDLITKTPKKGPPIFGNSPTRARSDYGVLEARAIAPSSRSLSLGTWRPIYTDCILDHSSWTPTVCKLTPPPPNTKTSPLLNIVPILGGFSLAGLGGFSIRGKGFVFRARCWAIR